jgi:hypothetical protein
VVVSGVRNLPAPSFDYLDLVKPPFITSVSPLSGPAVGGSVVTIQGLQFNGECLPSCPSQTHRDL